MRYVLIFGILSVCLALGGRATSQVPVRAHAFPYPICPVCTTAIKDQASGGCLFASSLPMDGMLLPLGELLFVDPEGNVGIGTKTPAAQLHVHGGCNKPLSGTVTISAGSTTVIGSGTAFVGELGRGRAICIEDEVLTVSIVLSPDMLEVVAPAQDNHSNVMAYTDGPPLLATTAAGLDLIRVTPGGQVLIGDPDEPHFGNLSVTARDVGIAVGLFNPTSPPSIGQSFYAALSKDILQVGDRNQLDLTFHANDDGGGDPDRRFHTYIEAVVEDPKNSTKSAALRFMTPSIGANHPGERMRVTGGGDVGIGTSTPSARLHVAGSAIVNGDLTVTGTKIGFKIDHPLDPENKYLVHTVVESSEMTNVYSGNVVLDSEGAAWVELPEWFDELNCDFRYQLTPIGASAPNLYIASEIERNRFGIAGGCPETKVSWQVTGIRHDAYAEAHPIAIEQEKPGEKRGVYLHPELYPSTESQAPR